MNTTAAAFQADLADLLDVAHRLHERRTNNDYPGFEQIATLTGMHGTINETPEPRFYFDRMTGERSSKSFDDAKDPRQVAEILGLALNNADTATAALLYRLMELKLNNVFDVDLVHRPHMTAKESRGLPSRVTMFQAANGTARSSWKMKVTDVFKGVDPTTHVEKHVRSKVSILTDAFGEEGSRFAQLLYSLNMVIPDDKMQRLLVDTLNRKGELVVTGAFCPDYSYQLSGNPSQPYFYTFDSVGSGVGLVAQQFARVSAPLSHGLTKLGIKHRFVLGIGDFEGDSQAILKRVGLTYEEFTARCQDSLTAFQAQVGDSFPLQLEMCDRDRCKGRLRPYCQEALERLLRGDYGYMGDLYGDPARLIATIISENGSFYQRWYGGLTTDEIKVKVLEQGAEYAALARIYSEDFGADNILVLSGDRPLMHAFDALYVKTPTLCVKRVY